MPRTSSAPRNGQQSGKRPVKGGGPEIGKDGINRATADGELRHRSNDRCGYSDGGSDRDGRRTTCSRKLQVARPPRRGLVEGWPLA
jgi:hypothetical protein